MQFVSQNFRVGEEVQVSVFLVIFVMLLLESLKVFAKNSKNTTLQRLFYYSAELWHL